MGLDDLLGLLFLFFFIVLPALQGLLRRGQQVPPDFEPDEILLPGEERRPASSTPAPSSPPAQPPVKQPAPSPKAQTSPPPPRPPRRLEQVERERQGRPSPSPRPPSEPPHKSSSKPLPKSKKTTDQWAFSTSTRAILNGVVWHQILAEPRSQYWRRVRKAKR